MIRRLSTVSVLFVRARVVPVPLDGPGHLPRPDPIRFSGLVAAGAEAEVLDG